MPRNTPHAAAELHHGGIFMQHSLGMVGMALPFLSSGMIGLNRLRFQVKWRVSSARIWMLCMCPQD